MYTYFLMTVILFIQEKYIHYISELENEDKGNNGCL